jgi:eukaryotic-like serine/threonine-protein kinase
MIYLEIESSVRPTDGIGIISRWVYAFDDVSRAERWRFPTGSAASSMHAFAGDTVYVGSDDRNLYALDAATGEERWRLDLGARLTTPLVDCGVLYVGTYGGALVEVANA